MKPKKVTSTTHPETSEIELTVSIDASVFEAAYAQALAEYKKAVTLDGFRAGHAPDALVASHVGEGALLEKAATIAIDVVYADILKDKKIDTLGRPEIRVTKMARGNDLEFTAKTAVFPELTLPDYKKIARDTFGKALPDLSATNDEVQKALLHMRRERARIEAFETAKKDGADMQTVFENVKNLKDEELPPLDDVFVKTLGDFEDVASFEKNVRENIGNEKVLREEERRRAIMLDALIEKTNVAIPDILARGEARRIEHEFVQMLEQNNTTLDAYLTHIKKTREDMEKEWFTEGKKRAVLQLVINEIAKKESITPDSETVEKAVAHLQEHYKDAPEADLRAFVENQEQNKAVLTFLELQGK